MSILIGSLRLRFCADFVLILCIIGAEELRLFQGIRRSNPLTHYAESMPNWKGIDLLKHSALILGIFGSGPKHVDVITEEGQLACMTNS